MHRIGLGPFPLRKQSHPTVLAGILLLINRSVHLCTEQKRSQRPHRPTKLISLCCQATGWGLQKLEEEVWARSLGSQCMGLGCHPSISSVLRGASHTEETDTGVWVCQEPLGYPISKSRAVQDLSTMDVFKPSL